MFEIMSLLRCLALAALVLIPATLVPAGESQSLRIRWQTGKTYTQETVTATTFKAPNSDVPGQVMTVTQTTTITAKKDPTPGSTNRLIEVRFAAIRGEMASGKQVMKYDSEKPDSSDALLGKAIGRAVGKTFVLVYDEHDRFREVRELGSLSAATGSVTGLSALADSRDVANLFRKSLEMGLPPLPVDIGATWTADETMTFPKAGDTHVEINGKFDAVEKRDGRQQAKISFEGKLGGVVKKDKPIEYINIGEGSTMAGVIYFDIEQGVPSSSSYTNRLKMIVDAREFPFEQKITTKMVSIEDSK